MRRLFAFFTGLLIFFTPTHFFLTFAEDLGYLTGLRVDYLIPKIWVSTSIAGMVVLLGGWRKRRAVAQILRNIWYGSTALEHGGLLLLLLLFSLRQFLGSGFLISTMQLVTLVLIGSLGLVLWANRSILRSPIVYGWLQATILFQTFVGLYQFFAQRSLVGYPLLGEPTLSLPLGLARTTIRGAELILPYGTTAHPNVLAGILAVLLLLLWQGSDGVTGRLWQVSTFITSTTALLIIALTGSVSAWLALLFGLFLMSKQGKKRWQKFSQKNQIIYLISIFGLLSLLPVFGATQIDHPSVTRRTALLQAAGMILSEQTLFGTGLGRFTRYLGEMRIPLETVRFVQPVHNGLVLLLVETGLLGLALVGLLWRLGGRAFRKIDTAKVLPLLPLLALDHYLVSLTSGLLLLTLYLLWPTKTRS